MPFPYATVSSIVKADPMRALNENLSEISSILGVQNPSGSSEAAVEASSVQFGCSSTTLPPAHPDWETPKYGDLLKGILQVLRLYTSYRDAHNQMNTKLLHSRNASLQSHIPQQEASMNAQIALSQGSIQTYLIQLGELQKMALSKLGTIIRRRIMQEKQIQRKSGRFPNYIKSQLERSFNRNPHPTDDEKDRLAIACDLKPKQVSNWFNNRRSRNQGRIPKIADPNFLNALFESEPSQPYRGKSDSDVSKVWQPFWCEVTSRGLEDIRLTDYFEPSIGQFLDDDFSYDLTL